MDGIRPGGDAARLVLAPAAAAQGRDTVGPSPRSSRGGAASRWKPTAGGDGASPVRSWLSVPATAYGATEDAAAVIVLTAGRGVVRGRRRGLARGAGRGSRPRRQGGQSDHALESSLRFLSRTTRRRRGGLATRGWCRPPWYSRPVPHWPTRGARVEWVGSSRGGTPCVSGSGGPGLERAEVTGTSLAY